MIIFLEGFLKMKGFPKNDLNGKKLKKQEYNLVKNQVKPLSRAPRTDQNTQFILEHAIQKASMTQKSITGLNKLPGSVNIMRTSWQHSREIAQKQDVFMTA